MVALRNEHWAVTLPKPVLAPEALGFLNHLRFVSMTCRAKPRTDLFYACALLHGSQGDARTDHADALMRCLNEALGKPARLHAPGVAEMTFDESWLVQMGLASVRGDDASLSFLLASRVAHEHRRLVRFLIAQISKNFSLT